VDLLENPAAAQRWSGLHRKAGQRIGLVPTMGALHDGHLHLVEVAKKRAAVVVVSIFVNPIQFNQRADFDQYPRPIEDDRKRCDEAGVDALYVPTAAIMYPPGFQTHVDPGPLAEPMEGTFRPGHFRASRRWSRSCSSPSARTSPCSARRTSSSWPSSGA
jgi:pantoate--beta-alanine ligase